MDRTDWQPIETAKQDGTWYMAWWPTMPISWHPCAAFNCGDGYGWLMPRNLDYGEIFPTMFAELPPPPRTTEP